MGNDPNIHPFGLHTPSVIQSAHDGTHGTERPSPSASSPRLRHLPRPLLQEIRRAADEDFPRVHPQESQRRKFRSFQAHQYSRKSLHNR